MNSFYVKERSRNVLQLEEPNSILQPDSVYENCFQSTFKIPISQNTKKLTPRERWQKAFHKIKAIRQFKLLHEAIKRKAKLFGREKISKLAITETSCVIMNIYIYIYKYI